MGSSELCVVAFEAVVGLDTEVVVVIEFVVVDVVVAIVVGVVAIVVGVAAIVVGVVDQKRKKVVL